MIEYDSEMCVPVAVEFHALIEKHLTDDDTYDRHQSLVL